MIKFFRKIRQKLLNKGKTTTYFKNAIWEIALVFTGFFILNFKTKNEYFPS